MLDGIHLEEMVFEETLPTLKASKNNRTEFNIRAGSITPQVAGDIVNMYKKGGKLSRKGIAKILRGVYKILPSQPNLNNITISDGQKITVVGDLHGQISDLYLILDKCGMPNESNRFCFNGDYVDRGENGLEIVCILLTMFVAFGPSVVSLNRGNHEDTAVCRVYGFEAEVKTKYDYLLFEMFTEVFNHLQLFTG